MSSVFWTGAGETDGDEHRDEIDEAVDDADDVFETLDDNEVDDRDES